MRCVAVDKGDVVVKNNSYKVSSFGAFDVDRLVVVIVRWRVPSDVSNVALSFAIHHFHCELSCTVHSNPCHVVLYRL